MFDFFRDMIREYGGIRRDRLSRRIDKEETPAGRPILPKWAKIAIWAIGALYLLFAVINIITARALDGAPAIIIKNALLIAVDAAVCICLIIKSRAGEIAAIIGIVVFVIFMWGAVLI